MLSMLILSATLALANVQDAFRFEYSTRTQADGQAYLVIRSASAQKGLKVKITGNDGTSISRRIDLPAGGNIKLRWSQVTGDVRYDIRFGDQVNPAFSFKVRRSSGAKDIAKLKMLSSDQELVKEQKIRYELPFAIIRYHNTVYGLDGQVLAENKSSGELSYAAGEELALSWKTDQEVFLIKTRVEDVAGRYAQDIRAPWSFDIPHTELVFDSGSSKVRASEAPKLDDAFSILANTLARLDKAAAVVHGSIPVTLFVVGHTDTVGSESSNRRLSMARAKSIARYFKKKGAWCGIEYAGMGEEGQAHPTADNVASEKNRRVVYTLSLNTPSGPGRPTPDKYRTLSRPRPRALVELPALPTAFVEKQNQVKLARKAEIESKAEEVGTADTETEVSRSAQGPVQEAAPAPARGAAASKPSPPKAVTAPSVPLKNKKAPGAHNKDCALVQDDGMGWSTFLGLWAMLGFRRRSRR